MQMNVNFVGQTSFRVDNHELEDNPRKLWDFETLGIRDKKKVHKALKDAILFNRN